MARRRSDMPLMILVVGIFTVIGFGVAVIYYSGNTPILQLVPEVEKRFGAQGVKTRFIIGNPASIEVHVPASAAPDERALTEVAVFSLTTYRQIAGPTTKVESCLARVKDVNPPRQARVTVELLTAIDLARGSLQEIQDRAGLASAEVEVLGAARTGASVRITGRTKRQDPGAVADKAVAAVSSLSYVGRVEVTLQGPGGAVQRRGGRDGP